MKTFGIAMITFVAAIALGLSEWEISQGWSVAPAKRRTSDVETPVVAHKPDLSTQDSILRDDASTTAEALAAEKLPPSIRKVDANPDVSTDAEATMRKKVKMLNSGNAFLQGMAGYTARIKKQELVGRELREEETMLIKCRHRPLSIYLIWETVDPGREALYVEGKYDGKVVAHDGGWKSRLPAFLLDTDGALAMRDARYPVTSAGLLGLLTTMLAVHTHDLQQSNVATCERTEGQTFDGRPCVQFVTLYKSPKLSPVYRKSVTLIDEQWSIPVCSRHFEWPSNDSYNLPDKELDASTLIEAYSFTEIRFTENLHDSDFDRTNPDFHFH